MTKKFMLFKIISNLIFAIFAIFFAYYSIDAIIVNNGLHAMQLLGYAIYTVPVIIYFSVYVTIIFTSKKYNVYDLIIGSIFILTWFTLITLPFII